MATQCPKCKSGTLNKVGDIMVSCCNVKFERDADGQKHNVGTCDFRITFENKIFGRLTTQNIRDLLDGKTITNKKGDKATLDIHGEYLIKIEFKEIEVTDF